MKKTALFAFCALIACLCASCSKEKPIVLDSDDIKALTPGVEWAVVGEPYAAFREEPAFESTVMAHARRGDVLEVKGKTLCKDPLTSRTFTWYQFEDGWLELSSVVIYDNRLKAQTAAAKLNP
ncbi:MAG: hypothetical protein IIT68_05865 [Treponema sp.]|nr:hypothetical protein [Treponema sp.]